MRSGDPVRWYLHRACSLASKTVPVGEEWAKVRLHRGVNKALISRRIADKSGFYARFHDPLTELRYDVSR